MSKRYLNKRAYQIGRQLKTNKVVLCAAEENFMPSKKKREIAKKTELNRLFKYWIEIRNLQDDTIQILHLTSVIKIALIKPTPPSKRILQIKDDEGLLEAEHFEELRVQLRQRYPDQRFERTLHWERDIEAEQQRDNALHMLARFMAEAAVDEALREVCDP